MATQGEWVSVWDVVGEPPAVFFFRFGGTVDQAMFRVMRIIAIFDAVWVSILISFGQFSWFMVILLHPTTIAMDLCINAVYAICVLAQLRTSAVNLGSAQEFVSPQMIFCYRIRSVHFWLDFTSLFGALWCSGSFPHAIAGLRIARMWRLSNGADDLYELHLAQLTSDDPGRNFIVLIVQLLLMIHMFSCTWFFASTESSQNWQQTMDREPRFFDDSFSSFYLCYVAEGARLMAGWGTPLALQMKTGVYTSVECIVSSFLAPVSCICRAWILTQLLEVVQQSGKDESKHLDKLTTLSLVLDSIFVPQKLRHRCLRYCSFLSMHNANHADYKASISILSKQLQEDIKISMFYNFVTTAPFFALIPEDVMRRLILAFETETYGPGQTVFEQGDTEDELYFILRGTMDVIVNGVRVAELQTGQHFGELALLYDQPRAATIIAKSFCMCCLLTRASFNQVLDKEPLVKLCVIRAIAPLSRNSDGEAAQQSLTSAEAAQEVTRMLTAQSDNPERPAPTLLEDEHRSFHNQHSFGELSHADSSKLNADRILTEISGISERLTDCIERAGQVDSRMSSLEDHALQNLAARAC